MVFLLFRKMAPALFCTKIEAQRICCTTSRLDELKNRQNYRVFVGYKYDSLSTIIINKTNLNKTNLVN